MDPPIWTPHVIEHLDDTKLKLYIDFSSTPCVFGGGCNVETALQVLYQANGDVYLAMERLLAKHESTNWTEDEIRSFERLIGIYGKNFYKISQDLRTKSVKECVQFYYRWKKTSRFSLSPSRTSMSTQATPSTSTEPSEASTNGSISGSREQPLVSQQQTPIQLAQVFPCKVCGRIFEKIKSRSAHMKRHKNER